MSSALERVADSPTYAVTVLEQAGTSASSSPTPTATSASATPTAAAAGRRRRRSRTARPSPLDGYTTLNFAAGPRAHRRDHRARGARLRRPQRRRLRTPDGSSAYLYLSTLVYDEAAGTMTDAEHRRRLHRHRHRAPSPPRTATELLPGWQVDVGFDNFVRAFTDESHPRPADLRDRSGPSSSRSSRWPPTFALGLFLAIVFNDMRMRGRKFYRVAMILPYAFPAFLSALVWAGMLNESFGFINQVLFGGARDPLAHRSDWLAKFSILIVNLWLGFPYMFLVCTGALQSIPEDLQEAATVDGAKPWAGVPADQAAAAAGLGRAAADRVVRVQLQQLQPDLHAHQRRAARRRRRACTSAPPTS